MKKIFLVLFLSCFSMAIFAQDNEDEIQKKGFQKEKLFTGGDLTVSFYTGGSTLGISPYLGYSVTKWLDAAVNVNFLYQGQKDIYNNKYRQTNFGPGAFVRLFPVNFLYVQAQYEHNFISAKYIPNGAGNTQKNKFDVNSMLIGAGYSSGRSEGNNTYFYFSLMVDVLQLPGSPYLDSYGRMIPVVKAGYNIGLFQGRQGNRDRSRENERERERERNRN